MSDTKDNLLCAKIDQASFTNHSWSPISVPLISQQVLLSTINHCSEYKQAASHWVTKFIPHYDSPWMVLKVNPDNSTVVLDLPPHFKGLHCFHFSLLHSFASNDPTLFPERSQVPPFFVWTELGKKFVIDKLVDKCTHFSYTEFLVQWLGKGPEGDHWLP